MNLNPSKFVLKVQDRCGLPGQSQPSVWNTQGMAELWLTTLTSSSVLYFLFFFNPTLHFTDIL